MYEEIALEISRVERECFERVRSKIAAQQLGEAWVDLVHPHVEPSPSDVASATQLDGAGVNSLVHLPVPSEPASG